ncbi:hypothetical protein AAY77_14265, partial [Providencia rettgeri]
EQQMMQVIQLEQQLQGQLLELGLQIGLLALRKANNEQKKDAIDARTTATCQTLAFGVRPICG